MYAIIYILLMLALIGAFTVYSIAAEYMKKYLSRRALRKAKERELKLFRYREAIRRKNEQFMRNARIWSDELKAILRR